MAKAKAGNTKEEPIEKQLWKTASKLRKDIDTAMENRLDKLILSNFEKINVEGRYAR
jgi:hypothetical protein